MKPNIDQNRNATEILHFYPVGDSMRPLIVPGRDSVYVKPEKLLNVHPGDVVLYRDYEQKLVLHRLYRKNSGTFFTVGDNQIKPDGPFEADRLVGRMVCLERKGRQYSAIGIMGSLYGKIWLCVRKIREISHSWNRGKCS